MIITRNWIVLPLFLAAESLAQNVTRLVMERQVWAQQYGVKEAGAVFDVSNPVPFFDGFIYGENLNENYPAGPLEMVAPGGAEYTFAFLGGAWQLEFGSQDRSLNAFPVGNYVWKVGSESMEIAQPEPVFPVVPFVRASRGAWANRRLNVGASETATGFYLESNFSDGRGPITFSLIAYGSSAVVLEKRVEDGHGVSIRIEVPPGLLRTRFLYIADLRFTEVENRVPAPEVDAGAVFEVVSTSRTTFLIAAVFDPPRLSVTAEPDGAGKIVAKLKWVELEGGRSWQPEASEDMQTWIGVGPFRESIAGTNSWTVAASELGVRYFRLKEREFLP